MNNEEIEADRVSRTIGLAIEVLPMSVAKLAGLELTDEQRLDLELILVEILRVMTDEERDQMLASIVPEKRTAFVTRIEGILSSALAAAERRGAVLVAMDEDLLRIRKELIERRNERFAPAPGSRELAKPCPECGSPSDVPCRGVERGLVHRRRVE